MLHSVALFSGHIYYLFFTPHKQCPSIFHISSTKPHTVKLTLSSEHSPQAAAAASDAATFAFNKLISLELLEARPHLPNVSLLGITEMNHLK